MQPDRPVPPYPEEFGLAYWMDRVMRKCEAALHDLAPESVHDLRVALRRCRSIADGYRTFDPDPSWKEMKKEGRILFRRLGELRDTQVMLDLVGRLVIGPEATIRLVNAFLAGREIQLKSIAHEALRKFNLDKWSAWRKLLPLRTHSIPMEGPAFQHLALECWHQARELHRQALRNRSQIAFHRLRIGLKKFRYTVENFLPQRHEQWGNDLRELQDLLGELHDLHVLWRTALGIGVLKDTEARSLWRTSIGDERRRRLDGYRRRMVGGTSLWATWRAGLPGPSELEAATIARLATWASFRDDDPDRTGRVTRLALQLYDGLRQEGLLASADPLGARLLLHIAALLHDIGFEDKKKRRKAPCRLIEQLEPPLGLKAQDLQLAALAVRYHRGAFPSPAHKKFALLTDRHRWVVVLTAGILRLAAVFASAGSGSVRSLSVGRIQTAILVTADSYEESDPIVEKLAKARHLLESACRAPVMVRSAQIVKDA